MAAMHEQQEYDGYTPEKFEHLRTDVKTKWDIDINAHQGSGAGVEEGEGGKFGVTLHWIYDPNKQTLWMQTVKVPFFLKESDVDQAIHNEVEGIK